MLTDYDLYKFLKFYFENENNRENTLLVMLDYLEENNDFRSNILRTRYLYNKKQINQLTATQTLINEITKHQREINNLSTPWLTFLQTGNILYTKDHLRRKIIIAHNDKEYYDGYGIMAKYFNINDAADIIKTRYNWTFRNETCYYDYMPIIPNNLFTSIGK
jgi:hypothetical protein